MDEPVAVRELDVDAPPGVRVARRVAEQVRAIVNKLAANGDSISFLDYLTYLPLFNDFNPYNNLNPKISSNSESQNNVNI